MRGQSRSLTAFLGTVCYIFKKPEYFSAFRNKILKSVDCRNPDILTYGVFIKQNSDAERFM